MRVLLAHNYYGNYALGGEGFVFSDEVTLLKNKGIEVEKYEHTNSELETLSFREKFKLFARLGYSTRIYDETKRILKRFQPDLLHIHNYKYVFSTAIFKAARDEGIPIVLSLHNYRLICPGGQLRRNVDFCEECVSKNPIRSLWRVGCASSFKYRLVQYCFYCQTHSTISNSVDAFVVPTMFGRQKLVEGGFDANKIFVKPYFLFEPSKKVDSLPIDRGKIGALFIGRLSEEKGISLLIDAWRDVDYPLTIVGTGPLLEWIKVNAPNNVILLGELPREQAMGLLRYADFLIFPSVCCEGLGMTLLEACALGIPVVASDLGGRREVIENEETGFLFESGNKEALRKAVNSLIINREERLKMGKNAREKYEKKYSPEVSFLQTMKIYNTVLERV